MSFSENLNNVCVVIPVFNEVDYLDDLLWRITPYSSKIICVDDGSTDGSGELMKANTNIELISHGKNRGKGYALKTGLMKSLEFDCDIVITMDADLQHLPEDIPRLAEQTKNYDIVIGNRLHELSKMPLHRIASNKLTSWLLSKKLDVSIKDSQSGFRAFRKSIVKSILPFEVGFEAETEMLIKAVRNNFTIGFVDIKTIYNDNESKMKSIPAITGFLKVLFRNK